MSMTKNKRVQDPRDELGHVSYQKIKEQLRLGKDDEICLFNKQIHILKVSKDAVGNLILAYKDVLGNKHLEALISRGEMDSFNGYMVRKKRLSFEPYLTKEMWMYDTEGNKREGKTSDLDINMNWRNGEVRAILPYPPPWATATEEEIEDITKLIETITGGGWAYEAVLNFMAQMSYEKRVTKARPTLILLGARATGKNLLVDRIMKRMLPGMWSNLPPDFERYRGYLTSKLVFLDEAESETTSYQLNSLAKILSGGSTVSMSQKFRDSHDININTYFVINSNKRPVMISEPPISEELNQWIVVELTTPLSEKSEYNILKGKYGSDFSSWIDRTVGAWMEKVLLKHYEENMMNKDRGRYGFEIPIKAPLLNLCTLSKSEAETDVADQLQRLWNFDSESFQRYAQSKVFENYHEYVGHFEAFKEKLALSPILRKLILPSVKASNFNDILKKAGIRGSINYKSERINGKIVSCILLDKTKFIEYVNPEKKEQAGEGENLFDILNDN